MHKSGEPVGTIFLKFPLAMGILTEDSSWRIERMWKWRRNRTSCFHHESVNTRTNRFNLLTISYYILIIEKGQAIFKID